MVQQTITGLPSVMPKDRRIAEALANVTQRQKQTVDLRPGMMLNTHIPYRLEKKIGEGGMGEVWKAEQIFPLETMTGSREVAMKFILTEQQEALSGFFESEAVKSINLLNNDFTVRAYDAGHVNPSQSQPSKFPYIAFEYIDGYDADSMLQKLFSMPGDGNIELIKEDLLTLDAKDGIRMPDEVVGFFIFSIAHSLKFAHGRGMIHRDISPNNMLTDKRQGGPKLTDFGVAVTGAELQIGGENIAGKLPYISREGLLYPSSVDGRSDLYSLGASGYRMITGFSPNIVFDQATSDDPQAYVQYLHDTFTSIKEIRPPHEIIKGVDKGLSMIVAKLLRNDPSERYPDAEAVIRDISEKFLYKKRLFRSGYGIDRERFAHHIRLLEQKQRYHDDRDRYLEECRELLPHLRRPFRQNPTIVQPRRLTKYAREMLERNQNPCRYTS